MEEFPPNSEASKERMHKPKQPTERDPLEKVVEGKVIRRKTPVGKRLAHTFLAGDAKTAKQYVVFEVIIPSIRDMVVSSFNTWTEKIIYGEGRSPSRRGGQGPLGRFDYNGLSSRQSHQSSMRRDPREDPRRPSMTRYARVTHNFDEIILATRQEAEEVIDRLFDIISRYEACKVSDLYELVGETPAYTDDKWGWTDIRGAGVTRLPRGGGYLLDLPRPEQLES